MKTDAKVAGARYQVLDGYGQPVLEGRLSAAGEVDVARLPPGLYSLKISAEGRTLTRRFAK